jgi:hypothetical protein
MLEAALGALLANGTVGYRLITIFPFPPLFIPVMQPLLPISCLAIKHWLESSMTSAEDGILRWVINFLPPLKDMIGRLTV